MVTRPSHGRQSLRRRGSVIASLRRRTADKDHSNETRLARHTRRTEELSRTKNKVRSRTLLVLPRRTLPSAPPMTHRQPSQAIVRFAASRAPSDRPVSPGLSPRNPTPASQAASAARRRNTSLQLICAALATKSADPARRTWSRCESWLGRNLASPGAAPGGSPLSGRTTTPKAAPPRAEARDHQPQKAVRADLSG